MPPGHIRDICREVGILTHQPTLMRGGETDRFGFAARQQQRSSRASSGCAVHSPFSPAPAVRHMTQRVRIGMSPHGHLTVSPVPQRPHISRCATRVRCPWNLPSIQHGREDSNLQRPALEADALPIELHPQSICALHAKGPPPTDINLSRSGPTRHKPRKVAPAPSRGRRRRRVHSKLTEHMSTHSPFWLQRTSA